jgi:hypothetical protein
VHTRRVLTLFIAAALLCFGSADAQDAASKAPPSVGMLAEIEAVVLPGSKLKTKPLEDSDLIVLRVTSVFPHGTANRYTLQYYGLEPGTYDLRDYLVREDGTSKSDLPSLSVEVVAVLSSPDARPHALAPGELPAIGGYKRLLALAGVIWGAVMIALLIGRRGGAAADETRPATLETAADRLRPLVEAAIQGDLEHAQKAELERVLLGYWRERLELENLDAMASLMALREHPDAGQLLRRLEEWLHQPPGRQEKDVDVAALLEPYQAAAPQVTSEATPA